jgi:alpha-tubulin suppressor-like RCC1 family protein
MKNISTGTRIALTRTGLVAAFLATAGVVAVEQSVQAEGLVRCWGNNYWGQCNIPADLGPCLSVATGAYHTIALRIDGAVRCWGYNQYGECDTPADLGPCRSVAGAWGITLAIRSDGTVRCWGRNNSGQCNTPSDLGTCLSVAAGGGWAHHRAQKRWQRPVLGMERVRPVQHPR